MAEKIVKKDWVSSFVLIGKPKIGQFTYDMDKQSTKSSWIFNKMNLDVDCGEYHGIIRASMMGGYSPDRESFIYVHGKDENGDDDYKNSFQIAWEDRLNESILEEVGDQCFIKIKIEKTLDGKLFEKKFLSEYDAIKYLNEYLTNDMVVSVGGNLNYSFYEGKVVVQKNIKRITLRDDVELPAGYKASFTQSILVDGDSVSLTKDGVNAEKGTAYVDARVLDYLKEYKGIEVRGQFPFNKRFEYVMDLTNKDKCKTILNNLFKSKNGVNQITFEGEFVESGATVIPTLEDLTEDVRQLVEWGVYTEEDAIKECSISGNSERRMVLIKPHMKEVKKGDNKTKVPQVFMDRFTQEELILDCMTAANDDDDDDDGMPWGDDNGSSVSVDSDMDWLENIIG